MLRDSIVLIPLLFCVACGGADPQHKTQIDTLSQQVSDLSEAYESQRSRLDRLREQFALLTDRLETRQIHGVAAHQARRPAPVYAQPQVYAQPYVAPAQPYVAPAPPNALPVVKLRPAASKAAPVAKAPVVRRAPVAKTAPQPKAPVAKAEPLNPAPVDTRPPITITQADLDALSGASMAPAGRRPGQPVPPPANAAMAGNLGVVPLAGPSRPRTRRAPVESTAADPAIAAYQRAYGLYRSGAFSQAGPALVAFVRDHGSHDYADNALFWVGQIQFDQSRFQAALGTFRQVVDTYPAGNKVPDALLMIGLTQAKLGRSAEGRETLARLRAMFPQTEAARKADARLNDKAGSM